MSIKGGSLRGVPVVTVSLATSSEFPNTLALSHKLAQMYKELEEYRIYKMNDKTKLQRSLPPTTAQTTLETCHEVLQNDLQPSCEQMAYFEHN